METNPTQPLPPENPLEEELEMVDDETISDLTGRGEIKRYKAREQVEKTKEEYGTTLLNPVSTERLVPVVHRSFQFWQRRLGTSENMELRKQPQNAKTLLLPAVDSILSSTRYVFAEAPATLRGINLDELVALRRRIMVVRAILGRTRDFVGALEALESQIESAMDHIARVVYTRIESVMVTHRGLTRELEPLKKLISQSAEDAVETRKLVDKARKQGKAEAISQMDQHKDKADNDKADKDKDDKAPHKP